MSVAMVGAGIAAVGTIAGMDAANNASYAQRLAADQAAAREADQYSQNRADQEPWRQRGDAAGNRLQYLMGLTGGAAGGGYGSNAAMFVPKTEQQFRNELMLQYTSSAGSGLTPMEEYGYTSNGLTLPNSTASIDQAGLSAAVQSAMAAQTQYQTQLEAAQAAADHARANDPEYGSLTRNFTNADFVKDPGYQFRMDEGAKGVERGAAARGGLLSGAAAKAMNRYTQDFASNEFGNAFNRDNVNKTNTYNRLAGISGTGQTSANQIANQGAQVASNIGQNIVGAGNARASGYIAQNNALMGGLSQGINAWQQQNALSQNSFTPNSYGTGSNPYSGFNAGGGWGIE